MRSSLAPYAATALAVLIPLLNAAPAVDILARAPVVAPTEPARYKSQGSITVRDNTKAVLKSDPVGDASDVRDPDGEAIEERDPDSEAIEERDADGEAFEERDPDGAAIDERDPDGEEIEER